MHSLPCRQANTDFFYYWLFILSAFTMAFLFGIDSLANIPNGFWLALLLSYLIGGIPFGLILSRRAGLGDIRTIGSGNIGATNVLRTGNKKIAGMTLALDMGKGILAVALASGLAAQSIYLCGFAVVLGHIFSPFLKFRGGKGVATSLGVLAALFLPLALLVAGLWLLVFYCTRVSSLAALFSIGITPYIALTTNGIALSVLCLLLCLLLFYTHRSNICRLFNKEELAIR